MPLHRADLPPLELLRTFEAAARHLSFTQAAAELFVTQSAVSRQIRALEDDLGAPLFERRHRALALTPAGESLRSATLEVLDRLRETVRRLRRPGARRTFTVTTSVGFASLWLVPRLPRFTAAHPDVDVRISAVNRMVDLDREDIDVAVRFGPRDRAQGTPLFGETVLPVCAPALAQDPRRPLREPADLARHVLLVTMAPGAGVAGLEWPMWLEAVGLAQLEPAGRLHFSQYDLLVGAAIAGQGVALGRMPLLADALGDGRLVAPFGRGAASPRGYSLITSSRGRDDEVARSFCDWLLVEAGADRVSSVGAAIAAPPADSARPVRGGSPPRSTPPRVPARRAAR
jgi:LysR family glycine cleavage system transcriptional activator